MSGAKRILDWSVKGLDSTLMAVQGWYFRTSQEPGHIGATNMQVLTLSRITSDYDRKLMAAWAHATTQHTKLTRTGGSMEMTDAQAGRGAHRPRWRPTSLGSLVQHQSSQCSHRVCGASDMSVKVWRRVDQPRGWPQVCGHARGQGHGQQGPHSGRSFPGSSPANAPVVRGASSHCSCLRFTFSPAPF